MNDNITVNTETFLSNAGNGFSINNATLRHEENIRYDNMLLQIARERLNGVADLRAAGLNITLNNIGVTLSKYERVGDMTAASIDMDGQTMGQNDRLTFDEIGVPIPIIHKEWELGMRQLEASRTRGEPLDTTQMAVATRIVMDTMENTLFNGTSLTFDGNNIYGYTTHPKRNTYTLTADWTSGTEANRKGIIDDVKAMLDMEYDDNRFGPFTIYVAKDIWANIQMDYNDQKGDNTVKQRIEAFVDITMVKPGDMLADGSVVMVQMTSDVVDMITSADIRNTQWDTNPFNTLFKVWTIWVPRIKADRNDSSGIVHGT